MATRKKDMSVDRRVQVMEVTRRFLKRAEVEKLYGIGRKVIEDLATDGKVRRYRIANIYLYSIEDIDRVIENNIENKVQHDQFMLDVKRGRATW